LRPEITDENAGWSLLPIGAMSVSMFVLLIYFLVIWLNLALFTRTLYQSKASFFGVLFLVVAVCIAVCIVAVNIYIYANAEISQQIAYFLGPTQGSIFLVSDSRNNTAAIQSFKEREDAVKWLVVFPLLFLSSLCVISALLLVVLAAVLWK
jgi:hypothetical protein